MPEISARQILDVFLDDIAPLPRLEITVFGGLVVGLHLDDLPPGEEPRETTDVDCVPILVQREFEMAVLEQELHAAGWKPNIGKNLRFAKISPSGLAVDLVPWFLMSSSDAVRICGQQTITSILPSGRGIRILTPAGSLATKLAAFQDRGRRDPYLSPDLEDIALLLSCCSTLEGSVTSSPQDVQDLIAAGCRILLDGGILEDLLEGNIPRGRDVGEAFAILERLCQLHRADLPSP